MLHHCLNAIRRTGLEGIGILVGRIANSTPLQTSSEFEQTLFWGQILVKNFLIKYKLFLDKNGLQSPQISLMTMGEGDFSKRGSNRG